MKTFNLENASYEDMIEVFKTLSTEQIDKIQEASRVVMYEQFCDSFAASYMASSVSQALSDI